MRNRRNPSGSSFGCFTAFFVLAVVEREAGPGGQAALGGGIEDPLVSLWRERIRLRAQLDRLSDQCTAIEETLPEWARNFDGITIQVPGFQPRTCQTKTLKYRRMVREEERQEREEAEERAAWETGGRHWTAARDQMMADAHALIFAAKLIVPRLSGNYVISISDAACLDWQLQNRIYEFVARVLSGQIVLQT